MAADAVATLESVLLQALQRTCPEIEAIRELRRLSGGASQETWSFVADAPGASQRLILRRAPGGRSGGPTAASIPLAVEAKLIRLAATVDVPVPTIRCDLDAEEGAGAGFVMDFVDGETIPRRILRDEGYAAARALLAKQCGEVLARIHTLDPAAVPELRPQRPAEQVDQYRQIYDALDDPRPVFELAFRWLVDHAPQPVAAAVVHGDFRNGNLIVGEDGLRAVLDWELAHVGDPFEDLGWICVNSWRFGEIDKPVGGFGAREDLFAAYEAAGGGRVDPERVRYWEVFGTLKWGVICMMMYGAYRSGIDRSVERAMIGRRCSETEIDLLELLAPQEAS